MSICDEIKEKVREGKLVQCLPALPGNHVRVLYLEKKLSELINDCMGLDDKESIRIASLMRDFDRFSLGNLVTIGYGKENRCFMKLLDPRKDEIWEIRSREPSPSYRIFGRFAVQDVFIALGIAPRKKLGSVNSLQWKDQVRNCKAQWMRIFPNHTPLTGNFHYDYIKENSLEISNLP